MKAKKKIAVAIIGEGVTEFRYFDSLRIAKHYSFQLKPSFPKHSNWRSLFATAEKCIKEGYDKVLCIVDMDTVLLHTKENDLYQQKKRKLNKLGVDIIETNPCTEFWFLLHFLTKLTTKEYSNCDEVLVDLRKYLPAYEKSNRYFDSHNIYQLLSTNGKLEKAMEFAERLLSLALNKETSSYTEIHKALLLLDSLELDNNT